MRRLFASALIAMLALLAGCGGGGGSSSSTSTSSTSTSTSSPVTSTIAGPPEARHVQLAGSPNTSQLPTVCPKGKAFMGCAEKATPQLHPSTFALPSGALFPDVSVWQGTVNWPAVAAWQRSHGWRPAAIFKMGEYTADSQAARNAQQTKALGFWRAGYWFVRNTGCSHELSQIEAAAHGYGLQVVVLDAEVPEARGYSHCLGPALAHAGFDVVEYTSPGSNPDGSSNPGLNLWVAAYGPSHPPCVFTCNVGVSGKQSILAWQFTDGRFGPVVSIPGLGSIDVSVDYGIERLGAAPAPKPKPKPKPLTVLVSQSFTINGVRVNELATGQDWQKNHCLNPVARAACRTDHAHLVLLRDRIYFLASHTADRKHTVAKLRWSAPSKQHPFGSRYAVISHLLAQH